MLLLFQIICETQVIDNNKSLCKTQVIDNNKSLCKTQTNNNKDTSNNSNFEFVFNVLCCCFWGCIAISMILFIICDNTRYYPHKTRSRNKNRYLPTRHSMPAASHETHIYSNRNNVIYRLNNNYYENTELNTYEGKYKSNNSISNPNVLQNINMMRTLYEDMIIINQFDSSKIKEIQSAILMLMSKTQELEYGIEPFSYDSIKKLHTYLLEIIYIKIFTQNYIEHTFNKVNRDYGANNIIKRNEIFQFVQTYTYDDVLLFSHIEQLENNTPDQAVYYNIIYTILDTLLPIYIFVSMPTAIILNYSNPKILSRKVYTKNVQCNYDQIKTHYMTDQEKKNNSNNIMSLINQTQLLYKDIWKINSSKTDSEIEGKIKNYYKKLKDYKNNVLSILYHACNQSNSDQEKKKNIYQIFIAHNLFFMDEEIDNILTINNTNKSQLFQSQTKHLLHNLTILYGLNSLYVST